jgi:hypothetical protein
MGDELMNRTLHGCQLQSLYPFGSLSPSPTTPDAYPL